MASTSVLDKSEFVRCLIEAQADVLKEWDSQIFIQRYGLNGQVACTLKAVGKQFGISRERVRQIIG